MYIVYFVTAHATWNSYQELKAGPDQFLSQEMGQNCAEFGKTTEIMATRPVLVPVKTKEICSTLSLVFLITCAKQPSKLDIVDTENEVLVLVLYYWRVRRIRRVGNFVDKVGFNETAAKCHVKEDVLP